MNKQILVVETLKAVAGKKELLKKALTTLVPICRQAPGCLKYDLFEPVEKKTNFLS